MGARTRSHGGDKSPKDETVLTSFMSWLLRQMGLRSDDLTSFTRRLWRTFGEGYRYGIPKADNGLRHSMQFLRRISKYRLWSGLASSSLRNL
jgi:hypothetical protein